MTGSQQSQCNRHHNHRSFLLTVHRIPEPFKDLYEQPRVQEYKELAKNKDVDAAIERK